ncbi:GntR family transcriptional regulator [Sporosarcina sp. PTS2304]|uniref:GntR family transcriptional regulator n=1 Tax=Sporosarcina sp. PTS2304 TaxID=2283194 RepID=UPI000E0D2398|nr:GntR family transcriptional regulator [Sporosarcina sp. PTS2304]AXI00637.1 GntR family transcriptional regulator [Sporosarcina sp. PTS2304]
MGNYLLLKDHVYNYIVEQINNGELAAGSKVNESAIGESLKVSRTPVREALIQLSSDGLLEYAPRKGFVIKELTKEEAKDTFLIIGALDGLATSLSAPLLTEKQLKEMEFYIMSMDLALNSENFAMYHKMQEDFHNVYLSICPNKTLVDLLFQLERKFLKNLESLNDTEFIKSKLLQTNNEHRRMVELFREGNVEELDRYMKEVHWNTEKAEIMPL